MAIDWLSFDSEEEVRRLLETRLTAGSALDRIRAFAATESLECSEPVDGIVYCSAPARSDLRDVRQKWLIKFHLRGDALRTIDVEKGYIGA